MIWERETPQAWAERLAALYPPADKLSHIECWWDPGTLESPVQRWVLVECIPELAVSQSLRDYLLQYPDTTPFRLRMVDSWQRTRKVPLAFWVIQGSGGGHKLDYSHMEQQWDQWLGGEGKAPEAGSLPYADFDERVVTALAVHDRLRRAVQDFEVSDKLHEETESRKMREAFSDWAAERAAFLADMAMPALLSQEANLPRVAQEPDYQDLMDRHTATGESLGGAGGFSAGPTAILKPV